MSLVVCWLFLKWYVDSREVLCFGWVLCVFIRKYISVGLMLWIRVVVGLMFRFL